MSYAVRNTIILFVTLFLFTGAGFSYLKFVQEAEIETLNNSAQDKSNDLSTKQQITQSYPELKEKYDKARMILSDYDKSLYETNDPDDAYDYLNRLASGNAMVYFDYVFEDTLIQDQFGYMRSSINGYGTYENLFRFIYRVENSQFINKISAMSINPASGDDSEYGEVTFNMTIDSYYKRINLLGSLNSQLKLDLSEISSVYNPFYPLITESVPGNTENLTDVERSRIIGLTSNRIFLVDQAGSVRSLSVGDKVYLGTLQSINMNNRNATFRLNKGGIIELVTLEIER